MAHGASAVKTAFVMNLGIFVLKLIAALITGSPSMRAEAIHSLADSGNQLLLLFGIKRSKKPACGLHPFGHGKEQFFWSFIVAMMLFVLGAAYSIYEGVHKLMHPEPLQHISLNLCILAVGMILEGYSWFVAWKTMDKPEINEMIGEVMDSKDSDTVVVFVEDSGALFGLAMAFAGNIASWITGNPFWDALSSVTIGCLLFVMAYFLANEMRKLMIGEKIDSVELRYVRRLLNADPRITTLGKMRSMQLGGNSSILMVDVDFKDDLHDGELDEIIPELKAKIRATIPTLEYIAIQPQKITKE